MPNNLGHRTQSVAYDQAVRTFLLGVGHETDGRQQTCQWNRDLVATFACTYYFPPCSANGTVLPPCRSLCTAVLDNWCEVVDRPAVDCGEFPDSEDRSVCVGAAYMSDVVLYRGEIRHGSYHERLLTDREIEAEYTGRLRRVRPLPECLCDAASTPALLSRGRYCGTDAVAKGTSSRLDQTHHEVEFVNDGDLSTAWASRRPSPNKIEIQINFRRPVEIWSIEIRLESQFPREGIVILTNRSGEFQKMQIMSAGCHRVWKMESDDELALPDSVNCQNISRLAGSLNMPPYSIKLDLRDGRPQNHPPPPSSRRRRGARSRLTLEEFLTSSAIRIGFYGQPFFSDRGSHIVREISVYTR
ncbi:hypothetical protein NP493_409g02000 [Ridgeia piscesae]|uniref:Uncharacterized protein n=1 Tax=Ridgeia piscesae TaxID=27915 RepID=A0AAD9L2E3_RIDPI|nr:hypothetical protein NP493_409g02000 [Ridgeia piscesae]